MSEAPRPQAEIVSVGLVTPVGLYAAAAAAAVAAGRSRARKADYVNKAGEGQAMHLVDEEYLEPLDDALSPSGMTGAHQRMLRLGGPALAEAAVACPGPAPLLLALPEKPQFDWAADFVGADFLPQLATQAGIQVDGERSATYRQGGAAALFALRDALDLLASKKASHVIVGGVDSFYEFLRLAALDAEDRLYGPRSRLGFLPGEGAGFIVLRAAQPTPRGATHPPPAMARLIGVGVGFEKGHRHSKEPYRGEGLAEAFETLFAGVPPDAPRVRCVYSGLNGEDMPAKEWGVARVRNSERFVEEPRIEHPAEYVGDSGAALGPIMLGLAALAINQGHLPGPRPIWATDDPGPCLVWSTSDGEPRGAAFLQR